MGEERASCHTTLGILFHISFFCGDKSLHLHSVVEIESVLAVSMLLLVHFLPERSDDVTYNWKRDMCAWCMRWTVKARYVTWPPAVVMRRSKHVCLHHAHRTGCTKQLFTSQIKGLFSYIFFHLIFFRIQFRTPSYLILYWWARKSFSCGGKAVALFLENSGMLVGQVLPETSWCRMLSGQWERVKCSLNISDVVYW